MSVMAVSAFLKGRFGKVAVALSLVVAAIAIFAILKATRPQVASKPIAERAWSVNTVAVTYGSQTPEIEFYGEIVAAREAELRALVGGQIVAVHENFVDGAKVSSGEMLVAVDEFDYLRNLEEYKAQADELEAELASERQMLPEDRTQLDLAEREAARQEKLLKGSAGRIKAVDDAKLSLSEKRQRLISREQTIAKLKSRLKQVAASVARAEQDVAETKLLAPFDGYLTDVDVAKGKVVATNDRLGRLIDSNSLEVRFHVSDARYARLLAGGAIDQRQLHIRWRAGRRTFEFSGQVDRVDARVDAATGGVMVFGRISGDDARQVLRPGVFVEVLVQDRSYDNVVKLPQIAFHQEPSQGDFNGKVYVVVDQRLVERSVDVLAFDKGEMLVQGDLKSGDQVVTTRFAEMGPGILVKVP